MIVHNHNSLGQTSPISFVPWTTAFGSQSIPGESRNQVKSTYIQPSSRIVHSPVNPKLAASIIMPEKEDCESVNFSAFAGQNKDSGDGQRGLQLPTTMALQPSMRESKSHVELGLGQPKISSSYPYVDQCFGLFAVYGAQPPTGRMLLPLNVPEDGPIYVNAKQYHGILRRRQSRAKAEQENKMSKLRKPYMHESRHRHAMSRPRGCGGRFLNTKNMNGGITAAGKDKNGIHLSQVDQSPGSVLESNGGRMNSATATSSGSNTSGSSTASVYSESDFNDYQVKHLRPAFHSLSTMMDSGQNLGINNKWVTAANGCCDFIKV